MGEKRYKSKDTTGVDMGGWNRDGDCGRKYAYE
jgi:hypothetical protein